MSRKRIAVTVCGTGLVAERVAAQIRARKDLKLAGLVAADAAVPAGSDCIVHVPSPGELVDDSAAARIGAWLRAGIDVVSTAPPEALSEADLRGACRAGGTTYHGTGGHPSRLVSRFNRAFSSITRNIREVELVEEREVAALPSADDTRAVADYYVAGLHTLADAVFGNALPGVPVKARVRHVAAGSEPPSRVGKAAAPGEQLIARRSLGEHLAYDTVWRQRESGGVPLRYRLNTQSSDAIGHVTIEFHAGDGVDPADHLACGALLDAIRPVFDSAPGILRYDLDINHVQLNDCLA